MSILLSSIKNIHGQATDAKTSMVPPTPFMKACKRSISPCQGANDEATAAAHVFEHTFVRCCASTLAGLKVANLFRYEASSDELSPMIASLNLLLGEKGVHILLLKEGPRDCLIYAYRPRQLQRNLESLPIRRILQQQGYDPNASLADDLRFLGKRIASSPVFPHEIGLFLGYPLHDVLGFIQHQGKNFCCCGCWKVYACQGEAEKYFRQLKKCQTVYAQKHLQGQSVLRLTITA